MSSFFGVSPPNLEPFAGSSCQTRAAVDLCCRHELAVLATEMTPSETALALAVCGRDSVSQHAGRDFSPSGTFQHLSGDVGLEKLPCVLLDLTAVDVPGDLRSLADRGTLVVVCRRVGLDAAVGYVRGFLFCPVDLDSAADGPCSLPYPVPPLLMTLTPIGYVCQLFL